MTELWVVRHGESEGNAAGIVQGRDPYPLTPLGREQAKTVARFLDRVGCEPEVVVTSPVQRCVETAAILGYPDAGTGIAFAEIEPGSAQGEPIGKYAAIEGMDPYGGESVADLYERVAAGLDALPKARVLIVTHGCVFKAVLAHLLGLDGRYWLGLEYGTCMRLAEKRPGVHALTHLLDPEAMVLK